MQKQLVLKIGGKKRTFTFGLLFIGEVLERLDCDYNEMLEKVIKNPFKYAPVLMFESLKNSYKKDKKEIDFTEDNVIEWLEKEELFGTNLILSFINTFIGNNENKTPLESSENESKDVKKK